MRKWNEWNENVTGKDLNDLFRRKAEEQGVEWEDYDFESFDQDQDYDQDYYVPIDIEKDLPEIRRQIRELFFQDQDQDQNYDQDQDQNYDQDQDWGYQPYKPTEEDGLEIDRYFKELFY